MSPKATIKIDGQDDYGNWHSYTFHVHLENKRIDLILKKAFFTEVELIIGMNLVPDIVQIRFYKALQTLMKEYNGPNQ